MRSANFSDAELLNGLISQDEAILREYYTLYFHSTRRFVLANSGTDEDARDLFQDVLLVIFQKVRKGGFSLTCSLGTYLYSVSRLLWLKELNKRKWISHLSADHEDFIDPGSDIESINDTNERLLYYRRCFERLSESCRKVLSLFLEGLSIAEITAIMGYRSDQHTKNRRYRCKLSLIQSIREEYGYNTVNYENNKVN